MPEPIDLDSFQGDVLPEDDPWDQIVDHLEDTPAQRFLVAIRAWNTLDFRRASIRYEIGLARDLEQKDKITALSKDRQEVLMQMKRVGRDLVRVLAEEKVIRDQAETWASIPVNIRPKLVKVLGELGIDVTEIAARGDRLEDR